ncbi:hypothetical protein ACQKWADRAFT_49972 [Trichoderma austrokoningii]
MLINLTTLLTQKYYILTMPNQSYIDKALKRVQDGERRAYMRLRTHLGLSPLPSRPSTSTAIPVETPPPIPARSPARGDHYTGNYSYAEPRNLPLNEVAEQEQKVQCSSNVVVKSTSGHGKEKEASCANSEKSVGTEQKSGVLMDDLSDAIGQAMAEWKDTSNRN